jgi:hypothetical protein
VLATYMHACPAPGLGRMAAVVRLESAGARLEGAAARVAQARPAPAAAALPSVRQREGMRLPSGPCASAARFHGACTASGHKCRWF